MSDSRSLINQIIAAATRGDTGSISGLLGQLGSRLDSGVPLSPRDATRLTRALAKSNLTAGGAETYLGMTQQKIHELIEEVEKLDAAQAIGDEPFEAATTAIHERIIDAPYPLEEEKTKNLLGALQNARAFGAMAKLSDRMIAGGHKYLGSEQMYAQALIDLGYLKPARLVIDEALTDEKLPRDKRNTLIGLRGRALKQTYVDHVRKPDEAYRKHTKFAPTLNKAIDAYASVYDPAQPAENIWHGINLVALTHLARADGIAYPVKYTPEELAQGLINALKTRADTNPQDQYDFATLGEAYVALGDYDNAANYYGRLAADDRTTAFQLASALRQLEQVWRIKTDSPGGKTLAVLMSALAKRTDGVLGLTKDSSKLFSRLAAERDFDEGLAQLEANITGGRFVPAAIIKNIYHCASGVAAIGISGNPLLANYTLGTGFLVRGEDFHKGLEGERLLLTNAHVISCPQSDGYDPKGISPERAAIRFELEETGDEPRVYELDPKPVWQSPNSRHDGTLLRFKNPGQVEKMPPLPISNNPHCLPIQTHAGGTEERSSQTYSGAPVTVMGHADGGPLTMGMLGDLFNMNGRLVDRGGRRHADEDPIYIHYRTPTLGGNSGSPVMDANNWEVVGLHHGGLNEYLNGLPGLCGQSHKTNKEVNEGICIASIKRAIAAEAPELQPKTRPKGIFGRKK